MLESLKSLIPHVSDEPQTVTVFVPDEPIAHAPDAAVDPVPDVTVEPVPSPYPPGEVLIRSYDDPTAQYGVKDAETFYRVYGTDSRFYIARGPGSRAALAPILPAKAPAAAETDA